jgi:hypothetical protein
MQLGCGKLKVLLLAVLITGLPGCDSPERVVQHAITAASNGNHSGYMASFTERSQAILRLNPSPWKTRPLGETTKVTDVRPFAENAVLVTVQENNKIMPLVVIHRGGTWRIDLILTEAVLTGLQRPF